MAWVRFALLAVFLASVIGQEEETQQITLMYTIVEEIGSSTVVGNVLNDAHLEEKYSGSQLEGLEVTFLSPPVLPFELDKYTGRIQNTERIDRDGVCAGEPECIQKMDVVVKPMFEIIKVSIQILDLNDNSPIFREPELVYHVLESADAGTNFALPTAMDPDSGVFGVQRYELISASKKFELKVKDKVDGLKDVRLVLVEELDRETEAYYQVKVIAFDGGNPPKTGEMDITIQVQDANDNDPVFDQETYEVTVPENAPIQTTILQVRASDPDSGSYGEVLYSFAERTLNTMGYIFGIVNTTGEIYVKGVIDYEEGSVYHLLVIAQDRGPDSVPSDTTVIVHVMDINDHSPHITVNTLGAGGEDTAEISEASVSGTFVAHITVVDPDEGRNAQFNCNLNENAFQLQRLNVGEYKIITNGNLNREKRSRYSLAITCKDGGAEPQVSIKHIQVNIMDINDNAPIFGHDVYTGHVIENNFVGVHVATVTATDSDIGLNAELEYKLGEEARDLFLINPNTGSITAQAVFDREQIKQVKFHVLAMDRGNPQLTGTATVMVQIDDVNDEQPKFTRHTYSFGVFENEPNITEVGVVTAEDADEVPNNKFIYSLISGPWTIDKFAIDPQTGKLSTVVSLDREDISVYYLTVVATDGGVVHMSSTASVTVYVADRNDNNPVIDYPSVFNNTIHVSNQVPVGYLITRVRAHDLDIDSNANLTFEIASGNGENVFLLDPRTGHLRMNRRFADVELQNFDLRFKVKDRGIPVRYAMANLNIVVNHSIVYPYQPPDGVLHGHNFTIVITLACVSLVIMVILVVAIVLLRRQDRDKKTHKYNCRMEALKMLHSSYESSKDGDSSQNMSNNNKNQSNTSCLSSGANERPRKEVSFSLDMDEGGHGNIDGDKTVKSWPSTIDTQNFQNPQACSSMLGHKVASEASLNREQVLSPPQECTPHGEHNQAFVASAQRPWALTQRELEVHQLLQMLKQEQDADAYSADGSNTDSGRGPSEEGENATNRHNTDSAQTGPPHHSTTPDESFSGNQVVPSASLNNSLASGFNVSTTSATGYPSQQPSALQTFSQRTEPQDRQKKFVNSSDYLKDGSYLQQVPCLYRKPRQYNRGLVRAAPARIVPSSDCDTTAQSPNTNCMAYASIHGYYDRHKKYQSDEETECTEASDEDGDVQYSVRDMSSALHTKTPHRHLTTECGEDDSTTTSGSYVVDPQELCNEINEHFFKDMIV
jgi:protocadherin delta 1